MSLVMVLLVNGEGSPLLGCGACGGLWGTGVALGYLQYVVR